MVNTLKIPNIQWVPVQNSVYGTDERNPLHGGGGLPDVGEILSSIVEGADIHRMRVDLSGSTSPDLNVQIQEIKDRNQ